MRKIAIPKSREIETGELAVQFFGRFIVGFGSTFGGNKSTDVDPFTVDANTNMPYSSTLIPRYTLESAGVVWLLTTMLHLLRSRSWPKITLTVIKSIKVNMVNFLASGSLYSNISHVNHNASVYIPVSIKGFSGLIPAGDPIPLADENKVISVNDSILSLRKRNKAVGLVKRLGNWMTLHLGHESSSKGLVLLSRYSTFALLLVVLSSSVHAQSTLVQATILDPSGKPYANASVTANFNNPSGQIANWNSFPMTATTWSTNANSAAFFTLQLPDLAFIAPATGTFYSFTICSTTPPVTGQPAPPCFTYTSPALPAAGAITGATIDISLAIQAVALPLSSGNCPLSGTVPCQFISTFGTPPVVPPVGQSSFTFNPAGAPVVSINGGPFFPFGGSGTFASLNLPNIFTASNQFTLGARLGPLTCSTILATSAPDGTIVYGSDCQSTALCLSGGTGAFAQRINSTWVCSGSGGGGGGSPGGPNAGIQINDGGILNSFTAFTFTKGTSTITFPDGATWSPSGIVAPTNALVAIDGSFGGSHNTGFNEANAAGRITLQAGQTAIPLGGANLTLFGSTASPGSGFATIGGYDGSGHSTNVYLNPFSVDSYKGFSASAGDINFQADRSSAQVSLFRLDRTTGAALFYGPIYLLNGAGNSSVGAVGAIPVSQGAGVGISPMWSSDLTGPFTLVGNSGTCSTTPAGSQNGFCFGPGNNAQAWDANISANWQNIVLANNVPAAGITGLIEPAQVDLTNPTGLGGLYTALNAVAQYCVPEWGATGVGPSGCPFSDATDSIVSAAKQLNLATFGIGPGIPNCSSTGTTINKLAKYSSSAGASCAVIASTADTQGEIGVVTGRSGTTGTAVIAKMGTVQLVMDGATTVNDWVINSPSVAGDGRDTGSTTCPVTGAQAIGRVQSTNGGAGTYFIELGGCNTTGGGGGGGLADPGSNGILSRTALNTTVARTLTGSTGITVTSADGIAGNPTFAIDSTVATLTGSQTLTNKTLTAPVISTISNTGTVTLPTATDTLVGRATTDTFTNKTVTDPTNKLTLACPASGPQGAITGNSAVQNIYSCTISGGILGANTCLHGHASWSHSGSASVTYNWSYGGSAVSNASSAAANNGFSELYLCNNGATNAQYASIGPASQNTTILTAGTATLAVDSTVNQTLAVTFNVASTDQVTPKIFVVELIH